MNEEQCVAVKLKEDEFSGLIGNFAGDLLRNKVGGGAGQFLGGLADNVLGGGGRHGGSGGGYDGRGGASYYDDRGGGGYVGGGSGGYGWYGGGGYDSGGGYDGGGGFGGGGGYGGGGYYDDRRGGEYDSRRGGGRRSGGIIGFIGDVLGGGGHNKGGGGYDGGSGYSDDYNRGGGSGKMKIRDQIGDILGGFIGGGGGGHGGGGGGGINIGDVAGIIGNLSGGGSKGDKIGGLISGIGGLISKNKGQYHGGGPNVNPNSLNGGMVDVVSGLVGQLAHRFLGVDPTTGKIIGAIAGNVIFNLGGKDNNLGHVGKVVLDNIISGKFKRKVDLWSKITKPLRTKEPDEFSEIGGFPTITDPFVKPEPSVLPRPPSPASKAEALDFYRTREQCLQERRLFEDPEFPACDSSLFFSKRPPKPIEWRRPGEIIDDPQLIYEGQSRFDVVQGELGDCWLLAAAANLTLRDELFYRVVPPDQSFTENYAGIFHFQFWQYGRWVDVVIDDRLPTSSGELLFMHSREHNEFWSALLEKAYAKLHGSYEALKGGTTSEALEDMTGGLTEFFDLHSPPDHLMEMMMRGFEMGSLFGCSIEADPYEWEARMSNGLVRGHAYSITGMRMVNGPRGRTPILRIRNPWGNEQEWNGAWSDNSHEWQYVSEQEKRDMGLVFSHDGEFWMSFDDFMRYFEKMEICNLGPDVMNEISQMTGVHSSQTTWATNIHEGSWIRYRSAGGCRNYIETFADNPQYAIHLTDSDPDDDDELCTVIIAVMQKYRRELKHAGVENLAIGFAVYDTSGVSGRLTRSYFQTHKSCARSAAFINLREVTARFRVPPGTYVIVPSTFEPNEEAEFLLRIYTNGFIESEEL